MEHLSAAEMSALSLEADWVNPRELSSLFLHWGLAAVVGIAPI